MLLHQNAVADENRGMQAGGGMDAAAVADPQASLLRAAVDAIDPL